MAQPWGRTHLELMTLLAIQHMDRSAYGRSIYRIISGVSNRELHPSSVAWLIKKNEAQGHIISSWDREGAYNVKRCALTRSGEKQLEILLGEFQAILRRGQFEKARRAESRG